MVQRAAASSRYRRFLALAAVIVLGICSSAQAERKVIAPAGTDVGLPFSPAILSEDLLFLAGAIGNQPGIVKVEGDAAAQTRQTLSNLSLVLKAADMDFSRVLDTNVFLSDARYFGDMAKVYAEHLGEILPTRTTVEADIAIPNSIIEIAMIAARPGIEIQTVSPKGWPKTAGAFSWGKQAGDTLFVAGMVSNDPANGELVLGDISTQTRQTMSNVGKVLEAADMSFSDVVACSVYLADGRDYSAMNEAYGSFFNGTPPARATVRARLMHPALAIEIQCRAVRGGENRLVAPEGYKASGRPLSPAIMAGDRLFLSGMVGRGPDGYPAGVEAQTRVALERLEATLEAAGMSFGDVEMASVFLTDVRHYSIMNEVYRQVVGSPPPARATVGSVLMSPEALVEVQMTARKSAASGSP